VDDRELVVDELAGAILDGTPVDWSDVAQRIDSSSADVLNALKVLAAVADVQRRTPGGTASDAAAQAGTSIDVWGPLRLLELVGRGSFGDVYRAQDPRLDRDVALKLLRARDSEDAGASAVIEEGRLLARVRHPNVVTIHGADRVAGRVGLWMEFIAGKSLEDILRTGRTFSPAEAAGIGMTLCSALAAIHRTGLLHRDIKTQNVIRADDGRIVLMDLGAGREAGYTGADLAGTPLYMAPEVLRGEPASVRSDVYSLGVLLYHLLTNNYHVSARTIDDLKRAHAEQIRTPLRLARPDLPAKLCRAIERAIDPDPANRYEAADAFANDLHRAIAGPSKAAVVTLSVVTAALVAALGWILLAKPVTPPRSVAVVRFTNTSVQADGGWLSTALQEMLISELGASVARAVPREDVDRMVRDLDLVDGSPVDAELVRRIGRYLDSQIVVSGSYQLPAGDQSPDVRLEVKAYETSTGAVVSDWRDSAPEADLFPLTSRIAARLRDGLGLPGLNAADADALRATRPATPEAMRLYAEGLQHLRRFDAASAERSLTAAVASDPAFARGHLALGEAWLLLRNPANARAAFSKAFEFSTALSREERLLIEGQFRRYSGGGPEMLKIQEALVQFFPEKIDHAVRLAGSLVSANRRQDALATIDNLRRISPESRDDPRVDLVEAQAARLIGDQQRARDAAARAAAGAAARGARVLFARAREQEAIVLDSLGRHTDAIRLFEEASATYSALGDHRGAAGVLRSIGLSLRWQGEFDRSAEASDRASQAFSLAGARAESVAVLHDLGVTLEAAGTLDRAVVLYEQRLLPALSDAQRPSAEFGLARLHYLRGDVAAAARIAKAAFDRVQSPPSKIDGLLTQALIALEQGELIASRRSAATALTLCRDMPAYTTACASTRFTLAAALTEGADFTAARVMLDEVVLDRDGVANDIAARHALAIAAVGIEDGRSSEAAAGARSAVEFFAKQGMRDERAKAQALLARLLVAAGKFSDAASLITEAVDATKATQNILVRTAIAVAEAEFAAATSEPMAASRARARLDAMLADTRRLHLVAQEFSLCLALGQLNMATGQAPAGRSQLRALAQRASALGFKRVARKAGALANQRNVATQPVSLSGSTCAIAPL
jgi:tetratricopeptide (TPR) repeat protein